MSKLYCLIAGALMGGTLMVTFASNKTVMNKYMQTMSPEQKLFNRYLTAARMKIWVVGLFLGVAVALFLSKRFKGGLQRGCAFAAIAMLVNYFFYMLYPKPGHMVEVLRQDQIDEWRAVRKMMQRNYHMGMLISVGALLVFGYFA